MDELMFSDVRRHTNRKVSTCNFQAEYYACYKILCHGINIIDMKLWVYGNRV